MRNEVVGNITVTVADSMTEYVDAVYAEQRRRPWHNYESSVRDSHWLGRDVSSVEDLHRITWEQWPEGVSLIEGLINDLRESIDIPAPVSRRRKRRWSEDSGDDVCLDRLRAGQSYWSEIRRQERHSPMIVSLVADMSAPASVNHKQVAWRGAAAVAMAMLLEDAGYRVELWAANHDAERFTNETSSVVAVRIKASEQPIDISAVASGMSAWFFRGWIAFSGVLFRSMRLTPSDFLGYARPLGTAIDLCVSPHNRIVIENCWSREAAIRTVQNAMQRYATGNGHDIDAAELAAS